MRKSRLPEKVSESVAFGFPGCGLVNWNNNSNRCLPESVLQPRPFTPQGAANIPVVDANAFMADMTEGYTVSARNFNADFLTGGAFSLDGVHPNDYGYALIANAFIETTNAHYDTNIPLVNLTSFSKPAATVKSGMVKSDVYLAIPKAFGGKIH